MLNYKIYCGDIDIKNCDNKTYVIFSFLIRHDDPRDIFFSLDTEKNQRTFIHFRQTPEYSTHNF